MDQKYKGFTSLMLPTIVLMLILVGGIFYFRKSINNLESSIQPLPTATITLLPTNTPVTKLIHLYPAYGADPKVSINKIHIISLLFIPKDINTQVKEEWIPNMNLIDQKIKEFYEKQFLNNIEITYQVLPDPIRGQLNIGSYTPYDMAWYIHTGSAPLILGST